MLCRPDSKLAELLVARQSHCTDGCRRHISSSTYNLEFYTLSVSVQTGSLFTYILKLQCYLSQSFSGKIFTIHFKDIILYNTVLSQSFSGQIITNPFVRYYTVFYCIFSVLLWLDIHNSLFKILYCIILYLLIFTTQSLFFYNFSFITDIISII